MNKNDETKSYMRQWFQSTGEKLQHEANRVLLENRSTKMTNENEIGPK